MNVLKELSEEEKELVVLSKTGMSSKDLRAKIQEGRELAQKLEANKVAVSVESAKIGDVKKSLELSEQGKVFLEKKVSELQAKVKLLEASKGGLEAELSAAKKMIVDLEVKVSALSSEKQAEFMK